MFLVLEISNYIKENGKMDGVFFSRFQQEPTDRDPGRHVSKKEAQKAKLLAELEEKMHNLFLDHIQEFNSLQSLEKS